MGMKVGIVGLPCHADVEEMERSRLSGGSSGEAMQIFWSFKLRRLKDGKGGRREEPR